jgi:hypothetical protein
VMRQPLRACGESRADDDVKQLQRLNISVPLCSSVTGGVMWQPLRAERQAAGRWSASVVPCCRISRNGNINTHRSIG